MTLGYLDNALMSEVDDMQTMPQTTQLPQLLCLHAKQTDDAKVKPTSGKMVLISDVLSLQALSAASSKSLGFKLYVSAL